MKKRTILVSKINNDHTGYVMNLGIEELSIFKTLKDNGLQTIDNCRLKSEEMISDEEMLMLLRHCCIDGFIEGVFSIENHFNRDQKEINVMKDNIEQKLVNKGIKIVTHTDWKPSFSDGGDVINKRNYLTILNENIEEKNNMIVNLELKFDNLSKEIETLEDKKKKINDEIYRQKELLSDTSYLEDEINKKQREFDILVERYKNGKAICEQQEQNAKYSWPKELLELEEKINNKKHEMNDLEDTFNEKEKELNTLDEKVKYTKNLLNTYESYIDNILEKYT